VPIYTPTENEVVTLDSKDPFYQIKVKDERTGVVTLASAKVVSFIK
jgi:hypothetical protein